MNFLKMTIVIQKAQVNVIGLTLSELSVENLPNNYLFEFIHEQSDKVYYCYLEDLNVSSARYNLFNLYEGTDITFKYFGDYAYNVYQMPEGTSEDTSLGILVEKGKMKLIETDESVISFVPNHISEIYVS